MTDPGLDAGCHTAEKIGELILSDTTLDTVEWEALTLMASFSEADTRMTGFRYYGRDNWAGLRMKQHNWQIYDGLKALQEEMRRKDGSAWHQVLVQVRKPGRDVTFRFEWNDPTLWSLDTPSLDLGTYALSLRPD